MPTSLIEQVLSGPAWLALLILLFWLISKTRTARTVDFLASVKAVDRQLRAEGIAEAARHKLIVEAARKHLDLPVHK